MRDGTFQLSHRRGNYIRRERFDDPDGFGKVSGKGSKQTKQEANKNASYSNQKYFFYPSQNIHCFDKWHFAEIFKQLIEHLHPKEKKKKKKVRVNISIGKVSNYALCILLIWGFSALTTDSSFPSQHELLESFPISTDISTDLCQTMRNSVWKLSVELWRYPSCLRYSYLIWLGRPWPPEGLS